MSATISLILVVLVWLVPAPSLAASPWSIGQPQAVGGVPPAEGPSGREVSDARTAAEAAARRVDALRIRYEQLSLEAAAAAGRLSAAFAEQARLAGRHDAAAAARIRAEAQRTASIRAVYADGGRLGLISSVLAADSPDDALWRIGTARRIQLDVLHADQRQAEATVARESDSEQAVEAAARADADLARALAEFQNSVAEAETTLDRAEAELNRLTATARRLRAAQEAARRLAAVRAATEAARLASAAVGVTAMVIPPAYRSAYQGAAATCPGLDWTLIAAVGQIESGHGRNNGPSSAGAIGPMQFMPATFAQYAVDGDHDGITDAWDHQDAIYSAAAYLCASGARGGTADGVRAALFAYNHAQWYVDLVLAARTAILRSGQS